MHRLFPQLSCLIATSFVCLTTAYPQDAPLLQTELTEMQQELDSLRMRLDGPITQASYSSITCGEGCTGQSGQCPHCSGGQPPLFSAGADLVFAKPRMKESFETTVTNVVTGTMQLVPFSYDHDLSPRFWAQFRTPLGPAIRGTYWSYDDGASPTSATAGPTTFPGASAVTVIFPAAISTTAPGDILNAASALKVRTLDIEGTQQFEMGGAVITGGAGLRHASMDQSFRGFVLSGGNVIQSLAWDRSFDGIGPTLSGDIRYPLGSGGLSVITGARGSLLYGEKTISRSVLGDVTPPPTTTPPFLGLYNADEVSGIFELALGVEYSRDFGRMGALFLRGTYEGQLWTAAGAPTLTFLGFEGFGIAIGLAR